MCEFGSVWVEVAEVLVQVLPLLPRGRVIERSLAQLVGPTLQIPVRLAAALGVTKDLL